MEVNSNNRKYSIKLSFEEIRLPPFEDILVLGKKNPQGKIGLYKSFELLVPNEFEVFEVDDKVVEAIFINKRLLKKLIRVKSYLFFKTKFSLMFQNLKF